MTWPLECWTDLPVFGTDEAVDKTFSIKCQFIGDLGWRFAVVASDEPSRSLLLR